MHSTAPPYSCECCRCRALSQDNTEHTVRSVVSLLYAGIHHNLPLGLTLRGASWKSDTPAGTRRSVLRESDRISPRRVWRETNRPGQTDSLLRRSRIGRRMDPRLSCLLGWTIKSRMKQQATPTGTRIPRGVLHHSDNSVSPTRLTDRSERAAARLALVQVSGSITWCSAVTRKCRRGRRFP